MRRFFVCCLLVLAAAAAPTLGSAVNIPDPVLSFAELPADAVGATVFTRTSGTGSPLAEAIRPDGQVVDATITVTLLDAAGEPVVNYPLEDIWIETSGGGLVSCIGGASADHNTDAYGMTMFTSPLSAGGCSAGETVTVMVAGQALAFGSDLPLEFRSPDLDGDLDVDLSDITIFTQLLYSYDTCGDFNIDGIIDLADITRMTFGIGDDCD
jgi:hypothetical protein